MTTAATVSKTQPKHAPRWLSDPGRPTVARGSQSRPCLAEGPADLTRLAWQSGTAAGQATLRGLIRAGRVRVTADPGDPGRVTVCLPGGGEADPHP